MASLDSLPPDQRAVLQLVLQRGRTYDEIAAMLSIDRANVRQRALAAFDLIGPETTVDSGRRHLLTDYLMGQLPSRVAEETRQHLASSPSERAWARVVASELAPIAGDGLPEIPTDDSAVAEPEEAPVATEEGAVATEEAAAVTEPDTALKKLPDDVVPPPKKSSRVGGAILLGLGVLIAIVVVVIVLVSGGSSSPKKTTSTPKGLTATTGTSTTPTRVIAQINLNSPNGAASPKGVAQVVKQANSTGIIIVAQGVAANTKHDAYAVWLFKPGGQGKILGFVNPGVTSNGRLQTAGGLPTDAGSFTQLLVTKESQANPKTPGTIILQGNLKLG